MVDQQMMIDAVRQIAMTSSIAVYDWEDRGVAPPGYVQGMAVAYMTVTQKYLAGNSSALEMARADSNDPDVDALTWYADLFAADDMDNSVDGLDTLRHLFVLLMGLGMRESSGQYCCGRDMSADNVSADTAEAGLFQMSWNMESCSDEMQKLAAEYAPCPPRCALEIFADGVTCSPEDWDCYGEGAGADYQELAKACPQFAVETAAIGLRKRRQHWGPINRREAELRTEADEMFQQVQDYVVAQQAVAENSVAVTIMKSGNVTVRVNGVEVI
ncbi:MAG: hypothetical protein J2P55_00275 [Rhizobiales bacterium]|nr:hypothetical protein [Hyphomicrobiales bacterium]